MKKEIINKLINKNNKKNETVMSFQCGRVTLQLLKNNKMMYLLDDKFINWFYFEVSSKATGLIDSRNLKHDYFEFTFENDYYNIDVFYTYQKTTKIKWHFIVKDNYLISDITINTANDTSSNYLAPLVFPYPDNDVIKETMSLDQKMLLVPYDNDMWVRYETSHLRPGLTSYDVTTIFNETSKHGIIIGAMNFDNFKNAIVCSATDARSYKAISGIADAMTHDELEHGYISGQSVTSSGFMYGYYENVQDGLEQYGKLVGNKLAWNNGTIFGWNSYSALTINTTVENADSAADFIYEKLPKFKNDDGVTYINFDAVFGLKKKDIKALIKKLHARKQKVGCYYMPLAHLKETDILPLKASILGFRKDLVLKKPDGSDYLPIDGKYPIDITNPDAQRELRYDLKEIVEMGYDYVKLDFLSHGALEGVRYNPAITTGRQALNYFYDILKDELDPNKIGRDIFISASISPLFPNGFAHSRRSCCDSFGHSEDTHYLLNALTFSYWTNDALYQFNDPDHTVLYCSSVDGMGVTSKTEARSRYNASIISGTNMLLSDNYGPQDSDEVKEAKKRAVNLCNNKKLNEIAKLNKAFKPLSLSDQNNVFYLNTNEKNYIAFFNYSDEKTICNVKPNSVNVSTSGKLVSLNENASIEYDGTIQVELEPYDSTIYEIVQ